MTSNRNKVKTPNRKLLFQETWLSEDDMRHQQVERVQNQGQEPVKDGAKEAENKLNSDTKPCYTCLQGPAQSGLVIGSM